MTDKERLKIDRMLDVVAGRIYHNKVMRGARPLIGYPIKDGERGEAKLFWVRPYNPPDPWYVRFFNWCSGASFENHRRP